MKRTLIFLAAVLTMVCVMCTTAVALELIEIEPEVKIEDVVKPEKIVIYSEPSGELELHEVTTMRTCYEVVRKMGMGKKYIITDSQDTARRFANSLKELAANKEETKNYRLMAKFASAEELPPYLMERIKTTNDGGIYVITVEKQELEKIGPKKNNSTGWIIGGVALIGLLTQIL